MCASFPFGFEDGIWDLIVLIPGHRLSFLIFKNAFDRIWHAALWATMQKFKMLKMVSLIYFIVSEINILIKFRWAICYTFKINCKSFAKMHGFPINMQ